MSSPPEDGGRAPRAPTRYAASPAPPSSCRPSPPAVPRPFSASGTPAGSLLTVLVHFGRHLPAEGPSAAGTFVAVSLAPPAAVDDHSDPPGPLLVPRASPYTASPYTASRVAASAGAAPAWNEVLVLPLPPHWRAAPSPPLMLRVDLVARGAGPPGGDMLLASRALPLAAAVARSDAQERLAWPLAPSSARASPHGGGPPTVFLSLLEHSRAPPDALDPPVRLELLVQSLTRCSSAPPPALPESLAALVAVDAAAATHSAAPSPAPASRLDAAFRPATADGADGPSHGPHHLVGLTAFAPARPLAGLQTHDWRFPLTFRMAAAPARIDVDLFGDALEPVARGSLELSAAENAHARALLARCSGAAVLLPPIPIYRPEPAGDGGAAADPRRALVGHLSVRARAWDGGSWREFVREALARRVVRCNRPAIGPEAERFQAGSQAGSETAPEWLGAVLRGLNRHPVASLCDDGGVAGVLAELVGGGGSAPDCATGPDEERARSSGGGPVGQLLHGQVAHLTSEAAAQRRQIERLQRDLDARLQAIRTCGVEMVALRRELQAKDAAIARLTAQLDAAAQREQRATAELLEGAASGGLGDDRAAVRLRALASKYAELEQEHRGAAAALESARRSVADLRALEARHAELQEAHVAQAALVQRLQRAKQQSQTLRRAVRVQERVIRQFEQAVAAQAAPAATSPRRAREDLGEKQTRDEAAGVRVRALERQLETNAREAAAEISALRLRVAELELAAAARGRGAGRG